MHGQGVSAGATTTDMSQPENLAHGGVWISQLSICPPAPNPPPPHTVPLKPTPALPNLPLVNNSTSGTHFWKVQDETG